MSLIIKKTPIMINRIDNSQFLLCILWWAYLFDATHFESSNNGILLYDNEILLYDNVYIIIFCLWICLLNKNYIIRSSITNTPLGEHAYSRTARAP
uniref:Uncharacterized protein n=1 Tax=Megaviridae environmental sample TaxID=1737588 RepID=A0A5J6VI46_9VIRU|nr:MAG: hypothetical protein [Megaviridae environmental sample]